MTDFEPAMLPARPLPAVAVPLGKIVLGGPSSLLAAPLVGDTEDALLMEAEQAAARGPDLLEWRADCLQGLVPERVPRLLEELRRRTGLPVLFTCRAGFEGGTGCFAEPERLALLESAIESKLADLVDVELATEEAARDRLLALGQGNDVPVMLSAHDWQTTPPEPDLLDWLAREQMAGAAVAKIATMARTPQDGLRLLSACAVARASFLRIPLVGIAMGPAGAFTRVLGPLFGVDLTFAAAVGSSAPGQLDLHNVREARRLLGVA